MTDIPITAALLGGREAIRDLDQLEQKTRSAARAVREYNREAGGSGGGGSNPNALRRTVAAGAAAGRLGAAGGALSGAFGLGGLTTGMAAIGAGLAVTGVAFQALQMTIGKTIEGLRTEAEVRQEITQAARDAKKSSNAGALGWLDSHGQTRMAMDALGIGRDRNLGRIPGGDDAVLDLARRGAATNSNLSSVEVASRTGLVTPQEAAKAVLEGARSASQILSGALDRVVSSEEVEAMLNRAEGGAVGRQVGRVRGFRASGDQLLEDRATGGAAARAAQDALKEIQNPNGSLAAIEKASTDQVNLLGGILEKMSGFEQFADAILNRDQSVSAQYNRAAAKAAATGQVVSETVGAGAGN